MARLLLEVLTPIAKSFPSEWCLEANSLAIQVHGGYGYTRDFPVEQYWRDNRLNMIHEGTHGIQAMDLLGRKVLMENGRGLQLLAERVLATADRADALAAAAATTETAKLANSATPIGSPEAAALRQALQQIDQATRSAWQGAEPAQALANAVPYMQAFGHTVIAWIWLDVANSQAVMNTPAAQGRSAACRYFFRYELPKIGAWLSVVSSRDSTCADLPEEAF